MKSVRRYSRWCPGQNSDFHGVSQRPQDCRVPTVCSVVGRATPTQPPVPRTREGGPLPRGLERVKVPRAGGARVSALWNREFIRKSPPLVSILSKAVPYIIPLRSIIILPFGHGVLVVYKGGTEMIILGVRRVLNQFGFHQPLHIHESPPHPPALYSYGLDTYSIVKQAT
jgi:hypothetical protein